jgi:hypothetical protein
MNMIPVRKAWNVLSFCLVLAFLNGCQTVYYETMEKFGSHKRDLLVSDVQKARDAQQDAKEQFQSALERFSKELHFSGGDLQDKYEALNTEYERSEAKAQAVHDHE